MSQSCYQGFGKCNYVFFGMAVNNMYTAGHLN